MHIINKKQHETLFVLLQEPLLGAERPGFLPDIMDSRLVLKTVRVFLSSTFTDTRVDRNALMEEVFDPIRDLCQEHGIAFEVVDLRWGRCNLHVRLFYKGGDIYIDFENEWRADKVLIFKKIFLFFINSERTFISMLGNSGKGWREYV
jgi:hypothetical protein